MTSPKTRRVLAELRTKDDNDVSTLLFGVPNIYLNLNVKLYFSQTTNSAVLKINIFYFSDASNVEHTTHNGLVQHTEYGYA